MDDKLKMYSDIKRLLFELKLEFRSTKDYEYCMKKLSDILGI